MVLTLVLVLRGSFPGASASPTPKRQPVEVVFDSNTLVPLTDTSTNIPTRTPTLTPTNTPTNTPTFTPTAVPFEACTSGFWKQTQHLDSWLVTGFSPNQTIESVFDVPNSFNLDNKSLRQALSFSGGSGTKGAAQNLLQAAVASLLNSAHPDVDFALTTSEVIQQVNAALASNNRTTMLNLARTLDQENNRGCPLN